MTTAARPAKDEYAAYYEKYTSMVPEGDVIDTLTRQIDDTLALLCSIPDDKANTSYEPGKWTIKELVGHVIDCERIFVYRALRFARGDTTPLPGFEQDDYVRGADFNACTLAGLADELAHVRASTVHFFRHLSEDARLRRGAANDNQVSVRAIAYIIAGHEAHHVRILREKYL